MKRKLFVALLLVSSAAVADDFPCANTACLVAAINSANATPAQDTITLESGLIYQFETAANRTLQPTALPLITTPIVIRGNGALLHRNPTLECKPLSDNWGSFALIAVAQGGHLIVENLQMRWGCGRQGGAIHNRGTLELYGVLVEDNDAFAGAGVYSESARLIARSSQFRVNTVLGSSGRGGGISVVRGQAELNLCDLIENQAPQGGGLAATSATVTYNGAARANRAVHGAGILALNSQLTLSGARLTQNTAGLNGGGITAEFSRLDITDTRIERNVAGGEGGGLDIHAVESSGAWSTIRSSSIVRNEARDGGGLSVTGTIGLLVIVNTTIAQNKAFRFGGGLQAGSGANVFVFHSTLASNDSMSGSSVASTSATARTELSGSILGMPAIAGQPICWAGFAAGASLPVSSGHNIGEDGSCNLIHPRDRVAMLAGLLPPRDTGRPGGWHFPLGISSIARDAGNFTACGGLPELRFDQLGGLRSDLMCDIGSIEFKPPF